MCGENLWKIPVEKFIFVRFASFRSWHIIWWCNKVNKIVSAEIQSNVNLAPKYISKGRPTHITIDNSHGRQQILTGLDTTHHTNATVYNPKNEETSTITQETIDDDQEQSRPRKNINGYNNYKVGTSSPPPIIGSYTEPWPARLLTKCWLCYGYWGKYHQLRRAVLPTTVPTIRFMDGI